jgi:hypothetical protein
MGPQADFFSMKKELDYFFGLVWGPFQEEQDKLGLAVPCRAVPHLVVSLLVFPLSTP